MQKAKSMQLIFAMNPNPNIYQDYKRLQCRSLTSTMEENRSNKRHYADNEVHCDGVESKKSKTPEVLKTTEVKNIVQNSDLYRWAVMTECYAQWAKQFLRNVKY